MAWAGRVPSRSLSRQPLPSRLRRLDLDNPKDDLTFGGLRGGGVGARSYERGRRRRLSAVLDAGAAKAGDASVGDVPERRAVRQGDADHGGKEPPSHIKKSIKNAMEIAAAQTKKTL